MMTKNTEKLFNEFNAYIKEKQNEIIEIVLSEQDLQTIFNISRMTLYRARKDGRLPFEKGFGGQIEYHFESLLLAINTSRFKVRGLTKLEAIERLKTYKKMLQL